MKKLILFVLFSWYFKFSYIFLNEATQCEKWAFEAAESRVYGGIHYKFDAEVGITQGKNVALYTIDIAKSDGAD